jgi:signal transduction histidine kinase
VIAEHGTVVEKSYAADAPLVYGVAAQLHQVFINLITNACHAVPLHQGLLVIETLASDGHLIIRITDNGAGIPADQVRRVFEPFFSTKSEGKGTGLGLSIVRNIVQAHNGEIVVDSTLDEGTTFEVVLPCPPDRR